MTTPTACEVCGSTDARCTFGRPSGPCSCWRGVPCRPADSVTVRYTITHLARIPLQAPITFEAPADASPDELARITNAALIADLDGRP